MPYCSSCGNSVDHGDQYCAKCGARQPGAAPKPADPLSGISPRTASILCYIPGIGWIASVIVLAADKFRNDRTVRFHAFQGLYLFVAWLIVEWVLSPIFREFHGLSMVVDRFSAPYLDGAVIDFVDTIQKQGFTIDNPNAGGSCACGDSFN